MAQYVGVLCDWCALLGIDDVPAATQRVIAVDGPPRRVDLCRRCDLALAAFTDLYDTGQDLPNDTAPRRRRAASAPVAARPASTPVEAAESAEATERAPRRRGGRVRDASKPSVVCPLDHPHSGGGPQRVSYQGRGSHADMVHGLHLTRITWEDPDGILRFPCEAHTACREHHVAFASKTGLTNHLNRYREPREDSPQPADLSTQVPAPAPPPLPQPAETAAPTA
ncbi:hypothetical protein [Streptacidiphilus monticola]|uniref:HNH endonuclease n=1 Tax=Streptacidiphilus monticola TaxID=2161674 RepID=A0ABW1G4M2_9ACTN